MRYNILLTFSNNYVKNVFPLFKSIIENVNDDCDIFLLNNDITKKNIEKLKIFIKKNNKKEFIIKIKDVKFPIEIVENLPTKYGKNVWSAEIYFRIFAPYILKDIDRCLYLDGDIIISKEFEQFYFQDFQENLIVAVKNDIQDKHLKRLQFSQEDKYFNSGVLLMDFKGIREHYDLIAVKKELYKVKDILQFPDQDFINIFFKGKIKEEKMEYNYMINVTEVSSDYYKIDDFVFCHYVLNKPWKIGFQYRTDWVYLKYVTPYVKKIYLFIMHRLYRFYKKMKVDNKLRGTNNE